MEWNNLAYTALHVLAPVRNINTTKQRMDALTEPDSKPNIHKLNRRIKLFNLLLTHVIEIPKKSTAGLYIVKNCRNRGATQQYHKTEI